MKKYALILISTFVLFVFGVSVVLANISLPPSNPSIEPPGPIISDDRPWNHKAYEQCVGSCHKTYKEEVERCRLTFPLPGTHHCIRKAQDVLQQCYAACKEIYLDPPPTLELPNGNSPGQGN